MSLCPSKISSLRGLRRSPDFEVTWPYLCVSRGDVKVAYQKSLRRADMVLPSVQLSHTQNIHIHTTQLGVDILTYTPCHLPLSKRKFKQVFRSLGSGHLPSPSRGQQLSFAPPSPSPSTCALLCFQSSANPHASNHLPSLTSAVLSSIQVHHSCLPAPSSAL